MAMSLSKPVLLFGVVLSGIALWFAIIFTAESAAQCRERKAKHPPDGEPPRALDTCRIPAKPNRDAEFDQTMEVFLGPNVEADDPVLIKIIARYFIEAPRPFFSKFSLPIVNTPQAKEVNAVLKNKKNGFFVECGAPDGEVSSNTIWLEQNKGWNGLLVEMDPSYYMQIRGKNRKCYSINACLSPESYPTKVLVKDHSRHAEVTDREITYPNVVFDTYCFPLYSLMLALNRTRIDYFSLAVEGMEMPILKSIPFDKLDIAVLTVKFVDVKSAAEYLEFMKSKGYEKVIYVNGDNLLFVREDLL